MIINISIKTVVIALTFLFTLLPVDSFAYLVGESAGIRRSLYIGTSQGTSGCKKTSENIECWGTGSKEMELAFSDVSSEGVSQVSESCYIKNDELYCWSFRKKLIVKSDYKEVLQIVDGEKNDYCVIADGELMCSVDTTIYEIEGLYERGRFTPNLINPRYVSISGGAICAIDDKSGYCWNSQLQSIGDDFIKSMDHPVIIGTRYLGHQHGDEVCVLDLDKNLKCSKSKLPKEMSKNITDFNISGTLLCAVQDKMKLTCINRVGGRDITVVEKDLKKPSEGVYVKANTFCLDEEDESLQRVALCWALNHPNKGVVNTKEFNSVYIWDIFVGKSVEVLEDLEVFLNKFYKVSHKIKAMLLKTLINYSKKQASLNPTDSKEHKEQAFIERYKVLNLLGMIVEESTSNVYEDVLTAEYTNYLAEVNALYPDISKMPSSASLELQVINTIIDIAIALEKDTEEKKTLQVSKALVGQAIASVVVGTPEASVAVIDDLLTDLEILNSIVEGLSTSEKTNFLSLIYFKAIEDLRNNHNLKVP